MSGLFEKLSISELLELDMKTNFRNKEIRNILEKKERILKQRRKICSECPDNTGKCSVQFISH